MTKKISLRFANTSFDMELDTAFAESLEPELEMLFNVEGNNDIKHLLEAYIKKSYEAYSLKKTLKQSIEKLS